MTDVNSIQVPQVNSLPPAPLRSEAGNTFAVKAEAFVAALPQFRIGMIALESVMRQLALIAQEEAAAAANSATAAANSATAAGSAKAAAESAKTAAASSATAAGTAKTAAEAAKTAAAASATAAAASATNAATSAVYAKDRLDYVVTQAGLTLNTSDTSQLQKAIVEATNLLGGKAYGALACIFMGCSVVAGAGYTQYGDFSKITKHANFAGAGYLHLKLHGLSMESMPFIDIKGHEYGANNYISESAAAYLYGASGGVYQQKVTNNANAPFFYYSAAQSAYMLRIKINSAYYLSLRLEAMDAYNINPRERLLVSGGMFTPITMETI